MVSIEIVCSACDDETAVRANVAMISKSLLQCLVFRYLPFSQKVSDELIRHVAAEQSEFGHVDLQKVAGRWSLESAGQILFERSLGSMGERKEWADGLIELNKKIFQLSAKWVLKRKMRDIREN